MARLTITTTPQIVCEGIVPPGGIPLVSKYEYATRTFTIVPPAGGAGGVVLLERGVVGEVAPDMDDSTRYDFAALGLVYACEPGIALWGATTSGTVDIDVLQGGER